MKNKRYFLLMAVVMAMLTSKSTNAANGLIFNKPFNIYTSAKAGQPIYKAIIALQRDIEKTTGIKTSISPLSKITTSGWVVVNSQTDKLIKPLTRWEEHRVFKTKLNNAEQVVLQGADMRGVIYAIYELSEKILGVPPLWYYSQWKPEKKRPISIPQNLNLHFKTPEVKYRAWFPNDMDLLEPWRKLNKENNEMWLETALRLKINTIEWLDAGERDFALKYSVSPTSQLVQQFGLTSTTHHHSSLNASFENWPDYWQKVRHLPMPELSLANEKYLIEYWRYNIETAQRAGLDMIWVLGFRGAGDRPFWDTFKDAPKSMKERGEVIDKMMKLQRNLVIEITKNPKAQFRAIFYDELSDLLAQGYIGSPNDPHLIWNFVAARRDHYPNNDIRNLNIDNELNLGYYFNYQFTSTGSHIAAAEGPWKMEQNYRYIAKKSKKPLLFSVVNAGNIREHVMELSANAKMMWDFSAYTTDEFLFNFCKQYYGTAQASAIAMLYRNYYNAYWNQKKADMPEISRQFIFQDLRYKRAIVTLAENINNNDDFNPLKDLSNEQLQGRTFRIAPADFGFNNQIESIVDGTEKSAQNFFRVAQVADELIAKLKDNDKIFFNDNLRTPAYLMYRVNQSLYHLAKAYQLKKGDIKRKNLVNKALQTMKQAQATLNSTAHGPFATWYNNNQKFNPTEVAAVIEKALNNLQ